MLVLTSREQDTVDITVPPSTEPTIIRVTTLEIRTSQVKTGFDAPRSVIIDREVITARKQADIKGLEQAERVTSHKASGYTLKHARGAS